MMRKKQKNLKKVEKGKNIIRNKVFKYANAIEKNK